MVKLSDVRASNTSLKDQQSLVCVFAGGTSGIGEATLKALASNVKDLRAYIIGRSEIRASRIIAECQKLCGDGTFIFLKADLTLLKNVDRVCVEIASKEQRLDLLFMSQGYLTLQGRHDTDEGIDGLMCLRYYSRMRMLYNFLPLLLKADTPRSVSVFAPGYEKRLYPEDLSLRTHYGIFNGLSHVAYMTAFFFEEVVAQNPTLSCLHVFPGLVKTAEFENGVFPGWLKWFFKWIFLPLITPLTVSVSECGERTLFASTSQIYPAPATHSVEGKSDAVLGVDGVRGSGVYAVDWDGGVVAQVKKSLDIWRKKDMKKHVWDHTVAAFKSAEKGEVFTG